MSFLYLIRSFASKRASGPIYSPENALQLLRGSMDKPDCEAFGIVVMLGVDPTKGDQMVKANVYMPAGIGKVNQVAVFIPEEHRRLAYKLGASIAGNKLMRKVREDDLDFKHVLATEEMVDELKPYARALGQKGLMPTVRNKTVIPLDSLEEVLPKMVNGTYSYRMNSAGIIHATLGRATLADNEVMVNLRAFMTSVHEEKPNNYKKSYIKKIFLTSTYGKAYRIDNHLLDINHYRSQLRNYSLS